MLPFFGFLYVIKLFKSVMDPQATIQWVECSRCQKWRIIQPLPDGSDEVIPEIWFCEMNRDLSRNFCDAPEEEYKIPEVPLVALQPILPPVSSAKQPRLAKINDPESIRTRLKQLSIEDLEAAFEHVDIERVFIEEFGDKLATARSSVFISELPAPVASSNKSSRTKTNSLSKHVFDYEAVVSEVKSILDSGKSFLPDSVTSQITRRYS